MKRTVWKINKGEYVNFQHWLYRASQILSENGKSCRDAETLLEFVTGKNRAFLFAFSETPLLREWEEKLEVLLSRRKKGEPIPYLIGKCEFWSLSLYVSPVTLIPRQDTECLVEQALKHLPTKPSRILDLGTGTGAIALAIASERPDCNVIAIDLFPDVVTLALRNVKHLSIKNVNILQSNWYSSLFGKKFEVIVSNPPYIDAEDQCLFEDGVCFEPLTALVSSKKGTADLEYIISRAYNYLVPGGWLLVEHGCTQGETVRAYFKQAGYRNVKTCYDYCRNERVTLGKIYKYF